MSTPAVPHLVSDTSADWSVSMATPTTLRPLHHGETPAVTTTTDEEVSGEQSVTVLSSLSVVCGRYGEISDKEKAEVSSRQWSGKED